MFAVERRSRIISLLNENKSLSVQEAAEYFDVAEETIRRDLNTLEQQRLLIRTHGGAVIADQASAEISYEMRQRINMAGKDRIGKEAAKLVEDGDTIILDASTSSFFVAKYIKNKKGVTVITNAKNVITELSGTEEIQLISTGGELRRKSMSYVGRIAESHLSNYHANKLFFSCMGFSLKRGLTDSNGQESDIKKVMIKCSQKNILLCDNTKFDQVGYASTAKPEDIDIMITDNELSPATLIEINNLGIKLILAE
ncbi:MAG: DeoR/GlpR family DNA-binding transcription regulator [Eubacteriales bacterium]|nr:DeoR/GlpR family DNA-binding transcription regulator [Eubacteriales bacterium]